MLKKTVTYEDWNGTTRTEDFYFNLTRTECMELEYSFGPNKTMSGMIQTLIDTRDMGVIISTLKEILLKAYGVKSDDGKRFIKNQDIRDSLEQSPAFDDIYMELATNSDYAADFIIGILPRGFTEGLGANPKKEIMEKASRQLGIAN